ncbi:hypothetical protein ACWGH2_42135 [Streptomyces sp. NPDC054871]
MKITIECADPAPPEIMRAVADLLAASGTAAGVTVRTDTEWTVDRAVKLLRELDAPRPTRLIEAAVEGDGWVDGPAFREKHGVNALRGPTAAITRAIKRGAAQGHWSADIPSPLAPTTPDKDGWSKTGGYYLGEGLVPVFTEALKIYRAGKGTRA